MTDDPAITSGADLPRPTFIVIGAMKCATSTVCAYLEDHPDVFMVPRAEPNFFSHDENWARGTAYYGEFFRGADGYAQRGEGSNDYVNAARYPDSATRMASFEPGLKLIYMVRDPLARIRSDWIQRRVDQADNVPADLREAVLKHPDIYLDPSLYWKNLSAYRTVFSDSAIFLGFMEDMKMDPEKFFADLAGFLGISAHSPSRGHLNPSKGKHVPSRLYTRINRFPGTALAKRLLPSTLKEIVKRKMLSKPAQTIPKGASILSEDMFNCVCSDAHSFLTHAGKPEDFWKLLPVSTEKDV